MINKKKNFKKYTKKYTKKKYSLNINKQENSKKNIYISFTNYLHRNKKLKEGIFLKKPSFKKIIYPFSLNLKLINEYLKKK